MTDLIAQSILQDALRIATKENELLAELAAIERDLAAGLDVRSALTRAVRAQHAALKLQRDHAILVATLQAEYPPDEEPSLVKPAPRTTPWWRAVVSWLGLSS